MTLKAYLFTVIMTFNFANIFSQVRIDTLKLITNDIAYDLKTDRIYATIPSLNGSNGNSIGIINPHTLKLEKTVFMGSEPSVIALSDDGKYAYTGFANAPAFRRFDIATQTAGMQVNLGFSERYGPIYVQDIKVLPKKSSSIAVARKVLNLSTSFQGIAIYDDSIMRPNTLAFLEGANKIQFLNDSILYGYVNEDTRFELTKYLISSTGIEAQNSVRDMPQYANFRLSFIINNQKAYFSNGAIVDITDKPVYAGGFNNSAGQIVYDTYKNLMVFASSNGNGSVYIRRFNTQNFQLEDEILAINAFPKLTVGVGRIVTCGNDCYAFNFSNDFINLNHIIIVRTNTTALNDLKGGNQVVIYPNPSSESIEIQSNTKNSDWIKYAISNINGTLMKAENFIDFKVKEKIKIAELPKGLYFLSLTDSQNKMYFSKFIKN
jgi:hypothetical protein